MLSVKENRESQTFSNNLLSQIVTDYQQSYSVKSEVNTQAIIENNFSAYYQGALFGERFLKHSVSLMIILGLMGTFFGLTLSVDKLSDLMGGDLEDIIGNLTYSVQGMTVAFNTSLFGIGCSVLLTLMKIIYSIEQKRIEVYVMIEDYLDNEVGRNLSKNQTDKYEVLVNAMENTLNRFGTHITKTFDSTVNVATNQMLKTSQDVILASNKLYESINSFDNSITTFVNNTRDFSEFNHQLRTNIERMSLTFDDFTEDLKKMNHDSDQSSSKNAI
jgi:methyl-accepting chemotaxis protein